MLLAATVQPPVLADDDYATLRRQMVRQIAAIARDAGSETGRRTLDERVMAAMGSVARHRFVPPGEERAAYANRPLPIGHGQTISQPYIVALMTDLLHVEPDHVVLEIGTGSGYQAAILATLAKTVCTMEIIAPLAREAGERLGKEGFAQVKTKIGDGYYGWEDCGPFDGIVVTAAAGQIPPPLIRQLKPGGRMVIPVGAPFLTQQLMLVEKNRDGTIGTSQILPVRFVPLTGAH